MRDEMTDRSMPASGRAVVGRASRRISAILGRSMVTAPGRSTSPRSPVLAIVAALVSGVVGAFGLVLGPASGGSEPVITGSVLLAFGLGWGLMAGLTTRYSAQPQAWMSVPAIALGSIGLVLTVVRPAPATMDVLSWIWPPALAVLAVWMVARVRRELHGRGRWLVVPMIATLVLVAIGGSFATISATTGVSASAMNGRLIDVGGHRLYVECAGTGNPTVILQAGLGDSSAAWSRIEAIVAGSTRVCAYDRAGHGRSDEVVGPQDGIALATDLHRLLERAGGAGPYVLVGHSSGGPYVRVFAERYPGDVAGMVLLDAQPADAFTALPEYRAFYEGYRLVSTLGPSLARIGLLGPILGLPADQSSPAAARSARDEIAALPETLQQAQALTTLGDRPLIVLTAGTGQQTGWFEAQDGLASLSTNSSHRVLDAATHTSLITGDHAPASAQAILDVVASLRAGTPVR
jgi:pimeloyl-ACP methyl ester carboxylesterase